MDPDQNFRQRQINFLRREFSQIKQTNKNLILSFKIKNNLSERAQYSLTAVHDEYRPRELSSEMLISDMYHNYHCTVVDVFALIQSFNKYSLSSCYVPRTIQLQMLLERNVKKNGRTNNIYNYSLLQSTDTKMLS